MLVGFTRKVSKQVQGTHSSETTLSIPTRENFMIGYRRVRGMLQGYTEGSFALQVGISINQNRIPIYQSG